MNQVFDINRIFQYSRLKFNLNRKMLVLSLSGLFGIYFVITFFIAANTSSIPMEPFEVFHKVGFILMLFAGALIAAGRSFQDMNTPEKALTQILIPASVFEKFLVSVVFSSIGWLILTVVSYEIFALLVNSLWSGVFGLQFSYFNVFNVFDIPGAPIEVMRYIAYSYISIHSVFFLGASAFKKYPIAKTALATFVINQAFSLLALVFMLILFGSLESFGEAMESVVGQYNFENLSYEEVKKYFIIPEIISFYIFPIILYTASYFKLKEREV